MPKGKRWFIFCPVEPGEPNGMCVKLCGSRDLKGWSQDEPLHQPASQPAAIDDDDDDRSIPVFRFLKYRYRTDGRERSGRVSGHGFGGNIKYHTKDTHHCVNLVFRVGVCLESVAQMTKQTKVQGGTTRQCDTLTVEYSV